ncbi:lamina-associated polypeptide 2, isoforms alpha/zeta-like [Hyperolius riggenbachi]|uniref:lamina-associated polypeptide 2, isoforms alpha/zeta-like n=1 Tax=Hyperolius riggenbachi TaxID=752182 RepID=UPI0035A32845
MCNSRFYSSSTKKLCQSCREKVVKEESPVVFKDLMGWMRSEMASAIKEIKDSAMAESTVPSTSAADTVPAPLPAPVIEGHSQLEASPHQVAAKRKRKDNESGDSDLSGEEGEISSLEEISGEEEENPEVTQKFAFAPNLMKDLLSAMQNTMGITVERKSLTPLDQMYVSLAEPQNCFIPVHSSLKSMIGKEWDDPERRAFWPKSLSRRYPFSPEDQKFWGPVPKLDPSFSRVSRKSDLQFENFGNLKDPIDKKMDNLLRRAWESASLTFKPAVASTAVGRSLKAWLTQTQSKIASGVPREEILEDFPDLFNATNYLTDAADDTVKLTARTTALVNSARRGIWVKTWQGDNSSRSKLCGLPCEGELLFGSKLDQTLERTSDYKKNFPTKKRAFQYRGPARSGNKEPEAKIPPKKKWIPNRNQKGKALFPRSNQPNKQ